MKKVFAVFVLLGLLVSIGSAQIGKRPAVDALRITAYDSLASRGPAQILGATSLYSTLKVQGVVAGIHTMVRAQNLDTLVITGANVDSTQMIFLRPVFSLAADTTGFVSMFPQAGKFGASDTILVYITRTSAARLLKYAYLIVRHN